MISVDYLLKNDKGEVGWKEYTPEESVKQIDGNIILLNGPSSHGKTTLMNMIAAGLYGETNPYISVRAKEDIKELINAPYRDLSFDIAITDSVTGIELQMSKKSKRKDISLFETKNGKRSALSKETFNASYNLIYDVPEDPTKRLEQIRTSVMDDHRETTDKVKSFAEVVKSIRANIQTVPSAQYIADQKKYIIDAEKDLAKKDKSIGELETLCNDLLCASLCREYLDIIAEDKILKQKYDAEMKKPAVAKSGAQLKNEAFRVYKKELAYFKIPLETRHEIIASRNADLITSLKQLEKINVDEEPALLEKYYNALTDLFHKLPKEVDKSKIEQTRVINDLLALLERKEHSISLGELGTVSDIIEKLKEFKNQSTDDSLTDYSTIRSSIGKISAYYSKVQVAADKYLKIDIDSEGTCRNEAFIESYRNSMQENERKRASLINDFRANSIILEKVTGEMQSFLKKSNMAIDSTLDEIKAEHREYSSTLGIEKDKRQKLFSSIGRSKDLVDKFEHGEKPPYYDSKPQLDRIADACSKMLASLSAANGRIEKIKNHDSSEYDKNAKIYDNIWQYIGFKLGTVTDCGIKYTVKSVDLLKGVNYGGKGEIHTEENAIIQIAAMGTGEGQLSYLKGILNTGDSRPIIAIFDEVGNMSPSLLRDLIDEMKRLHKSGKLLLAIMAKPSSETFEVTSFE